jgi:hypothetical protein
MNTESQNRVMLFRSMPLAQLWVFIAMLLATPSPVPCLAQGTPEQRLACTPDVLRLCSALIPDADEITTCVSKRKTPSLAKRAGLQSKQKLCSYLA